MILNDLVSQLKNGNIFIVHGTVLSKDQHTEYIEAKEKADYYDMLQGVRKVLL